MGIFKKLAGIENEETDSIPADNGKEEITVEEAIIAESAETSNEAVTENEDEWLDGEYDEGQLSIDVYQTPSSLVIKSTIAGVTSDDIDISINNDMLTIRGKRVLKDEVRDEDYLYKECYWGSFSRSIILPVEIEPEKIDAFLENGVLTVTLPKAKSAKAISIKVKEK